MNAAEAKDFSKARFGERAKFLPILLVTFIIGILWIVYNWLHCWPILLRTQYAWVAVLELISFNYFAIMLVICYVKVILTHPGSIPDKDWDRVVTVQDTGVILASSGDGLNVHETKRSGNRRHCKWCSKFKPDRCHHCRVCRSCILKMDHHCPWIYNCVGFRNYKYFLLFVFYSAICTTYIAGTMKESVWQSIHPETPFHRMYLLLFGETLAALLSVLIMLFLAFHIWLMLSAMTTIEFCEKSDLQKSSYSSAYSQGFSGNIRAALGDNPLLWFLPCSPPSGDGLSFWTETSRLWSPSDAM